MLTNTEARVPVYTAGGPPTLPNRVDTNTSLASLNLNWREAELPEKDRTKHVHRLHPYLGKFIPQLVEIFLRKFFKSGQSVLDPFCGSGTTLVQANELGMNAIGYDVSAFNVTLCRAKTAKYELTKVRQEVLDILEKASTFAATHAPQRSLWEPTTETDLATDSQYLQEWFAPTALRELLAYSQLIKREGYEYQDLLKIILSRAARSARLTTHFDLDFPKRPQTEPYHCYKHARICQPTTSAGKFLKRYSLDTITRITEFSVERTDASVIIDHADSRTANFPPIDGIITSPPYVGLIDYHQQHAYGYHLLGLEDRRVAEIGAAASGTSQRAQRQYQTDIATVFRRATARMPDGSPIIVVAADKHNLYPAIAEQAGVAQEAVIHRHVNRRTGRRAGEFFESVFIWRKIPAQIRGVE